MAVSAPLRMPDKSPATVMAASDLPLQRFLKYCLSVSKQLGGRTPIPIDAANHRPSVPAPMRG